MQETIDKTGHFCQNCGAHFIGNYCSSCGQSSTAHVEKTVFSIIKHFFEEMFTWDSRFFLSVKYLFIKPGYLTHEYMLGRINKYISPLKMFLFTSFVLFFIMISIESDQYNLIVDEGSDDDYITQYILDKKASSNESEEMFIKNFNDQMNSNVTLYIFAVMFIFSVLLKLIYINKEYYYSEHVVFTLHFFTFVLWCVLAAGFTQELGETFIFAFLYIVPGTYLFISVRRVYHKTLLKAFLASVFMTISYWILITAWMIGTMLISAYRA